MAPLAFGVSRCGSVLRAHLASTRSKGDRRKELPLATLITLHMEDEELIRLARLSAKAIRNAKGWRLAAGNLIWVVLSLQAASIGQIPVFLCCLGLLLTPLLVT